MSSPLAAGAPAPREELARIDSPRAASQPASQASVAERYAVRERTSRPQQQYTGGDRVVVIGVGTLILVILLVILIVLLV